MKKIYSLMCITLLGFGVLVATSAQVSGQASAQFKAGDNINSKKHGVLEPLGKVPVLPQYSSSSTTESFWLNAALANDSLNTYNGNPNSSSLAYPLFPDTNGLFQFSNGYFNTFVHLCGNVFDPLANNMENYSTSTYDWNTYNDYTVDSMAVGYFYRRYSSDPTPDTMVVYLYNDSNTANLLTYHFVGTGIGLFVQQFGIGDTIADTLFWKGMAYDYQNNRPMVTSADSMNVLVLKIPLTEEDTGVVINAFSTNSYHVPGGKRAASAVGFIPGYPYSLNDTINQIGNDFRIIAFQQNGTGTGGSGTYPTYFGTGSTSTGIKDWNLSEIATTEERYNTIGTGWEGQFLPPYLFVEAFSLEEWDIYYKVTSLNVGINNAVNYANGLKLYQNQPNPSDQTTLIRYETLNAGTVTLEVRDITGRLIMELNQGSQSAGKHFSVVDVSKLAKGMYTYTLRANDGQLTKRMIVE